MKSAVSTAGTTETLAGKRVLLVLPTLDLGGAERQALLLAEHLQRRAKALPAVVALYGGAGQQAVRRKCQEIGVPCLRVSMPGFGAGGRISPRAVRQFIRELRYLSPDAVMPYTLLPNVLCGVGWRHAGAATCVWGQRDAGAVETYSLQAAAMERTSCFVTNSLAGTGWLKESGAREDRIFQIRNAVRLEQPRYPRAAWRTRMEISADARVVCMLANVQPLKDHRTLLLAWKEVTARQGMGQAVLVLAGALTASAPALQALAGELGIAGSVRWLGAMEDVTGLLQASDLAVLSSRKEGLPNGILEPMAAGLAVVATDNEGAREALPEHQRGLLTPAGDASALAEAILRLLGDADFARELGAANRDYVQREYSMDRMGVAYEELLGQLLRGGLHGEKRA